MSLSSVIPPSAPDPASSTRPGLVTPSAPRRRCLADRRGAARQAAPAGDALQVRRSRSGSASAASISHSQRRPRSTVERLALGCQAPSPADGRLAVGRGSAVSGGGAHGGPPRRGPFWTAATKASTGSSAARPRRARLELRQPAPGEDGPQHLATETHPDTDRRFTPRGDSAGAPARPRPPDSGGSGADSAAVPARAGSAEVRLATSGEIYREAAVLTIPATRMMFPRAPRAAQPARAPTAYSYRNSGVKSAPVGHTMVASSVSTRKHRKTSRSFGVRRPPQVRPAGR